MEVWGLRDLRSAGATTLLAPTEAVVVGATRMAAGVHTTATEGVGARQRGVTPNVLFADTHVLSALDACEVAHLRFCERVRHMPAAASPAPVQAVPAANLAPDLMGTAVRGSVTSGHPWRRCVETLEPHLADTRAAAVAADAPPRLPNAVITKALRSATCARRATAGATEALDKALSSRGRRLKRAYPSPMHLNPV